MHGDLSNLQPRSMMRGNVLGSQETAKGPPECTKVQGCCRAVKRMTSNAGKIGPHHMWGLNDNQLITQRGDQIVRGQSVLIFLCGQCFNSEYLIDEQLETNTSGLLQCLQCCGRCNQKSKHLLSEFSFSLLAH